MNIRKRAPRLELTDAEKQLVKEVVRENVPPYHPDSYDEFAGGCLSASRSLPARFAEWAAAVKERYVGILENLPIDSPMPPTPVRRFAVDHLPMLSDGVISTVSSLFGTIYWFRGKRVRRHIQNIYPIPEDRDTQLAGSSLAALEWHVEDAFLQSRAHWLCLLCLRNRIKAETKVARAMDLDLPMHFRSVLSERQFQLRYDETFSNRDSGYTVTSILNGPDSDPEIVFDPPYTTCATPEAYAALRAVADAADEVQQRFPLRCGDLLIINNRKTLHARTAFHAHMDGRDRWIKRTLILESGSCTDRLRGGLIIRS